MGVFWVFLIQRCLYWIRRVSGVMNNKLFKCPNKIIYIFLPNSLDLLCTHVLSSFGKIPDMYSWWNIILHVLFVFYALVVRLDLKKEQIKDIYIKFLDYFKLILTFHGECCLASPFSNVPKCWLTTALKYCTALYRQLTSFVYANKQGCFLFMCQV